MNVARLLVALPTYNEEATVADIIRRVRGAVPEADVLVIDDGSSDATRQIVGDLHVPVAHHLCNLGYGRAVQTAIKYATLNEYDVLVTLDADGQHSPEQLPSMLEAFVRSDADVCVGSRFVTSRKYTGVPLGKRLGMSVFSVLVSLITGQRVYDTTSGFKLMKRTVFIPLSRWHFVDFHAEALVYLSRLRYRVMEHPIPTIERQFGYSMYSLTAAFSYPLKTLTMLALGLSEAYLVRRFGQR